MLRLNRDLGFAFRQKMRRGTEGLIGGRLSYNSIATVVTAVCCYRIYRHALRSNLVANITAAESLTLVEDLLDEGAPLKAADALYVVGCLKPRWEREIGGVGAASVYSFFDHTLALAGPYEAPLCHSEPEARSLMRPDI